jgi:hypothetical protein
MFSVTVQVGLTVVLCVMLEMSKRPSRARSASRVTVDTAVTWIIQCSKCAARASAGA